jgi:hypothetical protein
MNSWVTQRTKQETIWSGLRFRPNFFDWNTDAVMSVFLQALNMKVFGLESLPNQLF